MTNANEKRYVNANAREVETMYGSILLVDIKKEDFNDLPTNEYGYVKLTIGKRKDVGQYGQTHSVRLNEYKKDDQDNSKPKEEEDEDLPF